MRGAGRRRYSAAGGGGSLGRSWRVPPDDDAVDAPAATSAAGRAVEIMDEDAGATGYVCARYYSRRGAGSRVRTQADRAPTRAHAAR